MERFKAALASTLTVVPMVALCFVMWPLSSEVESVRKLIEEVLRMGSYSETVKRIADGKDILVVTTQNPGEDPADWYSRHIQNCRRAINGAAP